MLASFYAFASRPTITDCSGGSEKFKLSCWRAKFKPKAATNRKVQSCRFLQLNKFQNSIHLLVSTRNCSTHLRFAFIRASANDVCLSIRCFKQAHYSWRYPIPANISLLHVFHSWIAIAAAVKSDRAPIVAFFNPYTLQHNCCFLGNFSIYSKQSFLATILWQLFKALHQLDGSCWFYV